MAFKRFYTEVAYTAAGAPVSESRVSLIDETERVAFDGVNVETDEPVEGDAVYVVTETVNGGTQKRVTFLRGDDWLRTSLVPSNYEKVGVVVERIGDKVLILDKNAADRKYADVVQFELAAPALDGQEHSSSISCRVSTNYGTAYTIPFTYTATTLADVATALNTAIEAKKTADGWTNTLWAYMADGDNQKVDDAAVATKIIVQFDVWSNYQQYQCAGMTHITWGDMPANSYYFKLTKVNTQYRGMMNETRAVAYWKTNGRTPTANEPLNVSGNTDPVTLDAFTNSEYCALLRETFSSYAEYLMHDYGILFPQKRGCFGLPDGKALAAAYADLTVPTKDGGTKYKFPALRYGYNRGYGVQGLDYGDWYIPGVREGVMLMYDDGVSVDANMVKRKYNRTMKLLGGSQVANNASRWFAQRCSVYGAWNFYGTYGTLNFNHVYGTYRCQAVTLFDLRP